MGEPARLFVDTNVAIDYATRRAPFTMPAAILFGLVNSGAVRLAAAAMTFPFAYYIARKELQSLAAADGAVDQLRSTCDVVTMDAALIDAARANPIIDLEDAVQYQCALRFGAEVILTRDASDFAAGQLRALTPAAWLNEHYPR